MNWKKVSNVICDIKIAANVEGMAYKSLERPARMVLETFWIKSTNQN